MVRSHWCLPKSFVGMAGYLEALPTSAAQAVAIGEAAAIPTIVLSAGNTPPQLLDERDQMAHRSPRGEHIIARKSGHWIQLDEPDLVVEAIRKMVGWTKPS
jgi:pimeloyl-ACP methyl ester carboxylesterase